MNDNDLKAVISALETELNAAFEIAKESSLKKAAPGDEETESAAPAEGSESAGGPPPEATSPEPSASPAADAGGPPPDASAGGPPPEGSSPEGAPPGAEGSGDPATDQLSPEALEAEYSQLPPDQLKMHIEAALKAAAALQGAGGAGGPPGAPPMAPPGAPGASPSAGPGAPPPAMKGELSAKVQPGIKGELNSPKGPGSKAAGGAMPEAPPITHKSEDLSAVMTEFANLKKSLETERASHAADVENLTKAVKLVLERPERKAITGISYLKKTEEAVVAAPKKSFTPAEARAAINELIPTLSKSERTLVVDYYEGRVAIEKLAPILEKVK